MREGVVTYSLAQVVRARQILAEPGHSREMREAAAKVVEWDHQQKNR